MNKLMIEIKELKRKLKVTILAHIYQLPEVQDAADFVGDSLELARYAAQIDDRMIVFCGVDFMAETAAILNPGKKILLPDKSASCPMAKMISLSELMFIKKKYPRAKVVCYVNSTAEIKAESDICCTSANAEEIIKSLGGEEIIFVPDQYLAGWVAQKSNKKFITPAGFCPIHLKIKKEEMLELKAKHPAALVMCHPECRQEIKEISDFVLSTGQMLKLVKTSAMDKFIIATERGIMHQLRKQNPDKVFYSASEDIICPDMKKITLAKILKALRNPLEYQVSIPENIASKARISIARMLNHK